MKYSDATYLFRLEGDFFLQSLGCSFLITGSPWTWSFKTETNLPYRPTPTFNFLLQLGRAQEALPSPPDIEVHLPTT